MDEKIKSVTTIDDTSARTTVSKEKLRSIKSRHKLLYSLILLIVGVLFILGGTSYGIYDWQHNKVVALNTKTNSLQSQITSLSQQLASKSAALSAAQRSAQQTTLSECDTNNLSLSISQPNGTAETSYIDLDLTNTSAHNCTLNGYPTVVLVNAQGQLLGQPASQSTSTPATSINLQPGQIVHATVSLPNPSNFSAGACSAPSSSINVTPPDETTGLQAATIQQYCPGFSVTAIQTGD